MNIRTATIAATAALALLLTGCADAEQASGGPQIIQHDGGEVRIGKGVGLYPANGAAIITTSAGVRIANLPTIDESDAGIPANSLYIDARGFVYRVVP